MDVDDEMIEEKKHDLERNKVSLESIHPFIHPTIPVHLIFSHFISPYLTSLHPTHFHPISFYSITITILSTSIHLFIELLFSLAHIFILYPSIFYQKTQLKRSSRMCGECASCLRTVDCGKCDFCKVRFHQLQP